MRTSTPRHRRPSHSQSRSRPPRARTPPAERFAARGQRTPAHRRRPRAERTQHRHRRRRRASERHHPCRRLRRCGQRTTARRRHRVRDRIDHQDLHRHAARAHGPGRRGRARRSRRVPAPGRHVGAEPGRARRSRSRISRPTPPGCRATRRTSNRPTPTTRTPATPPRSSTTSSGPTSSRPTPARTSSTPTSESPSSAHALALRAGMSFEDLVRTRILEPLHMTSTGITLDAATAGRFVDGHDARDNVTSRFDMAVLAGAGGLRSSVNDMLKFAAANLDPNGGELHRAMASARAPRRPTDAPNQKIALGWDVDEHRGNPIVWHGGATGGFFAYIGLDPDSSHRRGRPQQLARQGHRRHRRPPPRPHPAAPRPADAAHRSRAVPRGPRPLRR